MQEQKQAGTQAHSARAITRGWRCFAGALAVLCGFVALNLAGCGGGGGGSNNNGSTGSATVMIQVRDATTGALLPSDSPDPNFTPPPAPTTEPGAPTPTPTPLPTFQPLTVRLVGSGYDQTTTFNNPTDGATFSKVPTNVVLQVFVNGALSGPSVIATKGSNGTQTFQVFQGVSGPQSKFLSKVNVFGFTRLTFGTASGACTNSAPVTLRSYLIRVRDISQPGSPVVALRKIPASSDGSFTLNDLPLQVLGGKAVTTAYQADVFSDPSDNGVPFAGSGPRFSLDGSVASGSSLRFDLCAARTVGSSSTPVPGATANPTVAANPTPGFTPQLPNL